MSTDNSFELIRIGNTEVRAGGGNTINRAMTAVSGLGASAITCLAGIVMNGSPDIRSTIGVGVLGSIVHIGLEKARDGSLPAIK